MPRLRLSSLTRLAGRLVDQFVQRFKQALLLPRRKLSQLRKRQAEAVRSTPVSQQSFHGCLEDARQLNELVRRKSPGPRHGVGTWRNSVRP